MARVSKAFFSMQGTARALALPAADRAAVHAHASAAQWDEWDDDYDDSFDDLGVVNLDGTADVEGETIEYEDQAFDINWCPYSILHQYKLHSAAVWLCFSGSELLSQPCAP